MRLFFVRHAAVVPRPEQPSALWHLSAEGRAGADTLAAGVDWSFVVRLYSSPEPKALATAQRIAMRQALPLAIDTALAEVDRPWTEGDYRALARRYLEGEAIDGWEPRDAALQRVQAAIDTIAKSHAGADVGVVSHGLALSLYLANLLAPHTAPTAEMWSTIRFPDLAVVDMSVPKLLRPFGT